MAINKKLIHFKNKTNFNNEIANNNILDTSIVFIQDAQEIYTHGTEYQFVNWSKLMTEVPQGYTYFVVDGTEGALLDSEGKYFYTLK